MSTTIESILATPDKKKEIEYNIITAMSKDISRGYTDLRNTVSGGGKRKLTSEQQKKARVINGQITTKAEQREQTRLEKRSYTKS